MICCLCVCVCVSMTLCVVYCHNYQPHWWDVLVTMVTKDCHVLHSKVRSDDREITWTHTLQWHKHKQKANSPTPSSSLSQTNITMLYSISHIKERIPCLIRPISQVHMTSLNGKSVEAAVRYFPVQESIYCTIIICGVLWVNEELQSSIMDILG